MPADVDPSSSPQDPERDRAPLPPDPDSDTVTTPHPDGAGERVPRPTGQAPITSLLARIRDVSPRGSAELAQALATATYRRVHADRLRDLDIDAAAKRVVSGLAFIDQRPPGTLALRVYNPDYDAPASVVEINVEDGPFLLSTVTEELTRLGQVVVDVMHPVFGVRRGEDGGVIAILPARQSDARESWIYLRLRDCLSPAQRERIGARLEAVLADARAATRDFPAMKAQVDEVAFQIRASAGTRYRSEEVDEAISLLSWLLDDHFVLLGYREYDVTSRGDKLVAQVRAGSGLGILADESSSTFAEPVPLDRIDPRLRDRMLDGELLVVSRTNRLSTVHRQAPMIYVGLRKVGGDGQLHGEYRFLGLFAQKAYAEPASTIPVLRRKLRQILEAEDIVDHSYDERALRVLFEAFPKHELFATPTEELRPTLLRLLEFHKSSDARLVVRQAGERGDASVLVSIPRERFNAPLRKRLQQLLIDRLAAATVEYHLTMTERDRALLHFVLTPPADGALTQVSADDLEGDVNALTRTWADDLLAELVAVHGDAEGRRLAAVYAARFPAGYAETTSVATALDDIAALERLCADAEGPDCADVTMALRRDRADSGLLRFNLYKMGPPVELSAFLPILESLGLVVVEEIPYRLEGSSPGAAELHISDFAVRGDSWNVDVDRDGPRLAAAATAIWNGQAESDRLNRLVLRAGMSWEEVAVLRAYRRYRRQVGTTFSSAYLEDALVSNPNVTRALLDLFRARLDPDVADAAAEQAARQRVLDGCDAVERLDTDRILRNFLGMIDATVRTNWWVGRRDGGPGRPYLSLKFDSADVPDVPKPVPHREIFVSSVTMEGVHLRGGAVARGGLRWSDRIEDYRGEVLGLMKAQMVKNAVIVPTGSKGGFVLRSLPEDRAALPERVRREYETLIRGLLDVTDNVVGGKVVSPPDVRPRDGNDAYLVVAADRGTASFSDLANAVSAEYGFWMGDAFASGGSRGYDHKAMGITARGAWMAVTRHFRELGIDIQTEPFTAVGIGDMSGDVFGNGMLRSQTTRLVAAFDHRHIFLDPDPDALRAFAERQRLFELDRSSWQDYDRDAISEGGGVWSRGDKAISLSPQVRATLRVDDEVLAPPDLIKAILRAPVDLLFAAGMGTFVRGPDESDADVGDRSNDAIRVEAAQVAARVVGEGANLGFTQRGRIAYARRGGRINTDAVDNAAGVGSSDREVNLKILLGEAIAAGHLERAERDAMLAAMTDDVAAQVLRDVYLQTWCLSQEVGGSAGTLQAYEALLSNLEGERGDERAYALDREVEVLPSRDEMKRRRAAGAGMTRPELAVLLGHTKAALAGRLLNSDLPEQPALRTALSGYFPALAAERFNDVLHRHPLRRELISTVVANDLVNRMGITYASRTARELGCTDVEVSAAYWTARQVSDADAHWRAVEALDEVTDPELQLELKVEVDRLVDAFTRSYLRHPVRDIAAAINADRPAFHELEKSLRTSSRRSGSDVRRRYERYTDLGIDPDIAELVVSLGQLTLVPDVAAVARSSGQPVRHVAEVFYRLTEALPLDRLGARLARIAPTDPWERWQHRGLLDDLRELRRAAAVAAITEHPDALATEAVDRFLTSRQPQQHRAEVVLGMLDSAPEASLSAVAVAVRALSEVAVPS